MSLMMAMLSLRAISAKIPERRTLRARSFRETNQSGPTGTRVVCPDFERRRYEGIMQDLATSVLSRPLRLHRQQYRKRRPLARFAFHTDAAAVFDDDPAGDGQAETGAVMFRREERFENALHVFRRNAGAVVGDPHLQEPRP